MPRTSRITKKGLPIWKSFLLTRARNGCHKVQWTLALARPRGALASREIEPKLQSSWVSRSGPHFSDNKKGLPIWKSFLLSKRARDGCHKVQWTLALARPRGALASREIEPKLQSSWVSRSAPRFSDNKKGLPIRKSFLLSKKARDGDRTRDPLLGKEVLHH